MKFAPQYKRGNNAVFHVLALFVATVWGVSFISTSKLLDAGLPPTEIYIIRFIIAYLVIRAFTCQKLLANSVKDEVLFLLCGLCGGSIYYIGENMALEYTLVTNVSLLVTLSPILTVLLTRMMYKNEKLNKGFILGSIIAFFGVACVIFNSSFNIQVKPIGDLLSLFAALSFSIYCIIVKKLNARYDTMFITRKIFFYGVITAIPFFLMQEKHIDFSVFTRWSVWGHILFLGIICSMVAFILWNEAIKKLGANRASNYLYFSPLITLVASAWFLHEAVSVVGVVGCLLIIGGVVVSEKVKFK